MDYLWTGTLPQDPDKCDRLIKLGETYRTQDNELQVLLPVAGHHKECWVNVPRLVCRVQLLGDIYKDLAYCEHDKLLGKVCKQFWWPGMHEDVSDCVCHCKVLQKDQMPVPLLKELQGIDKGTAPFLGWSIDAAGPFPKDSNRNQFLLVLVDPFSKWVEAHPVPLLHSWCAVEFLEDIMHRWGKPRCVRMDHGLEFKESFVHLCKVLGIVYQKPTSGNSKGNEQAEHVIHTIKDAIHQGLSQWLDTIWSDHVGLVLIILRFMIA